MKHTILAIFSLLTLDTFAQTKGSPKYVDSVEELHLTSASDSASFNKRLLAGSIGDVFTSGKFDYRITEKKVQTSYRVTYIYLDGSKLALPKIDSIRQLIILKHSSGMSFVNLAKKYNMDGNPNNGDTNYFEEGRMEKVFEDAIRSHKTGEIFIVDIPSNNWYYVVKKTHADKTKTNVTVLKTRNSS